MARELPVSVSFSAPPVAFSKESPAFKTRLRLAFTTCAVLTPRFMAIARLVVSEKSSVSVPSPTNSSSVSVPRVELTV